MLEDKLETLANQIGQFGLAAAVITFAAMAGQFSWHTLVVEGKPWDWAMLSTYLKQAITAITILVCGLTDVYAFGHARGQAMLCTLLQHALLPAYQCSYP